MKKYYLLPLVIVIYGASVALGMAGELNPLLESSVKYRNIRVAKVLAVDRLLLENDEKIALIGIKGPKPPGTQEIKRDENGFIIPDSDPTTPMEVEAFRFARELSEGKPVQLEFDTQRRDDAGNILAYVVLADKRLLNAELVRAGYAELKLSPPNMKYAPNLRAAYQEARRERRGLQGTW